MPDMQFLAFAGSLRRASYNRGLIRAATASAPLGISVAIHDLDGIPLFNQDVERAGEPPKVIAFKQAIETADALLVATPECGGASRAPSMRAADPGPCAAALGLPSVDRRVHIIGFAQRTGICQVASVASAGST